MPTILRVEGYRFFFFASDGGEPCHVHVSKAEGIGKVWLEPELKVQYLDYFTVRQKREVVEIIRTHETLIKEKWNEFFNK